MLKSKTKDLNSRNQRPSDLNGNQSTKDSAKQKKKQSKVQTSSSNNGLAIGYMSPRQQKLHNLSMKNNQIQDYKAKFKPVIKKVKNIQRNACDLKVGGGGSDTKDNNVNHVPFQSRQYNQSVNNVVITDRTDFSPKPQARSELNPYQDSMVQQNSKTNNKESLQKSSSQGKFLHLFKAKIDEQREKRHQSTNRDIIAFTSSKSKHRFLSEGRKFTEIHSKRMLYEIKKFKEIIKQRFETSSINNYVFPRQQPMIRLKSQSPRQSPRQSLQVQQSFMSNRISLKQNNFVAQHLRSESHDNQIGAVISIHIDEIQDIPPHIESEIALKQMHRSESQGLKSNMQSFQETRINSSQLNDRIMQNILKNKTQHQKLLFKTPQKTDLIMDFKEKKTTPFAGNRLKINNDYYDQADTSQNKMLVLPKTTTPKHQVQSNKESLHSSVVANQQMVGVSPKVGLRHISISQKQHNLNQKLQRLNPMAQMIQNSVLIHNSNQSMAEKQIKNLRTRLSGDVNQNNTKTNNSSRQNDVRKMKSDRIKKNAQNTQPGDLTQNLMFRTNIEDQGRENQFLSSTQKNLKQRPRNQSIDEIEQIIKKSSSELSLKRSDSASGMKSHRYKNQKSVKDLKQIYGHQVQYLKVDLSFSQNNSNILTNQNILPQQYNSSYSHQQTKNTINLGGVNGISQAQKVAKLSIKKKQL
ncbi:UNKNOWN [Stylonychia lemnae]|uniref:Uncharacterized protein n=1 Tax=Stylonychia lemnae TaxID=5949 RepID=A0A078AXU5_STYLE|nr:UNKNOWN [Stylonychia lemnae]|eukprot:CDW86999.1 UNKNOWN [Stylonychia lemnae]